MNTNEECLLGYLVQPSEVNGMLELISKDVQEIKDIEINTEGMDAIFENIFVQFSK